MPSLDIQLRDVTAADLPIFYEFQRDPEAAAMAAFPSRDWEAFHTHWQRNLQDATTAEQTIVVDGQVAGNIVCFDQQGRREVGYWLGRAFWGRGVATRALELFLGQIAQRPLYAGVVSHNLASLRVLEKCGFKRVEGAAAAPLFDDGLEELLLMLAE
jgi:RimJ/RimL family protein N-acetyltransferase